MQYLHTHTHTYIQYILAICQKMSWLGTMFVYTSQLILKALMMDFKKLIEGVDWLFICQHSLPILRRTLFHLAMTKRMFSNCNKNNLVRTYPSGKAYVHISRLCYGYIEIPCTLATTKLTQQNIGKPSNPHTRKLNIRNCYCYDCSDILLLFFSEPVIHPKHE